jgi:hypothetical protein
MGGAIITAQVQTGTAAAPPVRTAQPEILLPVLQEESTAKRATAAATSVFIGEGVLPKTVANILLKQGLTTPETEMTLPPQTGAMAEEMPAVLMQCAILRICLMK